MRPARIWLLPFAWGLVCGLPLALSTTVLQAWLTTEGYSMATVGFASALGLPYSLKMLWAPWLDRVAPVQGLGLRRGWLLLLQMALAVVLAGVALVGLSGGMLQLASLLLLLVVLSASQDIVVDAWRSERYRGAQQPQAAAAYVSAYRIALWLCAGLGLVVAQWLGFRALYGMAATVLLLAAVLTYATTDTGVEPPVQSGWLALSRPWLELWRRPGVGSVVALALLYKLGDALAAALSTPFLLHQGYTLTDIGLIAQGLGLWATVGGSMLGGWLLGRMPVVHGLWMGAILQALSTAGYVWLAYLQPDVRVLTAVVCVENATAGLGTAAFIGFLASQARAPYTATQYALLSSLAAVPRTILAGGSGVVQAAAGWPLYFGLCVVAAVPGFGALLWWQRSRARSPEPPLPD